MTADTPPPPGDKRPYTMSESALAQRRAAQPGAVAAGTLAGKSSGPVTEDGKANVSRNGWKHGRYSAANRAHFGLGASSISKMFGKPCLTTCPFHPDNADREEAPCSLVLDGLTHAGGSCLDKTVYVRALDSLMRAMDDGDMDGMHGLLATELASNLEIVSHIRKAIAEHGVMVPQYLTLKGGGLYVDTETGKPFVVDVKLNPALAALAKFTETHGFNFAELLATPRARQRIEDEDTVAGGMQAAIGAILARASGRTPRLPQPRSDDGE